MTGATMATTTPGRSHRQWRLPRTPDSEEQQAFRRLVAAFLEREMVPHEPHWRENGRIDKNLFAAAGAAGLLGFGAPTQLGGLGQADFRLNAILREEAARAGVSASAARLAVVNDVCLPYFLVAPDPVRRTWVPAICQGAAVPAIAMTEPSAGSDLAGIQCRARRAGDHYLLDGAKTMISNAHNADVIVVAAKTDPEAGARGVTLLVVDATSPGVTRGRTLKKAGQPSSDLGEFFFDSVHVPTDHLIGAEGTGFGQLMANLPRERLSIALDAIYQAEATFAQTLAYTRDRYAFGQPVASFQANKFTLAELRTELDIAHCFLDAQIAAINTGQLSAEAAAQAKWWCTELCLRVVDRCVQLHGGYGYMDEYPVSRAWRDTRVMTLYGGTTEVMKEIIGRGLGIR